MVVLLILLGGYAEALFALSVLLFLRILTELAPLQKRIIDFHRNDGNYPKLEQKRPETLSKHISVEFR